jgi:hypothetical protein
MEEEPWWTGVQNALEHPCLCYGVVDSTMEARLKPRRISMGFGHKAAPRHVILPYIHFVDISQVSPGDICLHPKAE